MSRPELEIGGEARSKPLGRGSVAEDVWRAAWYNPYVSLAAGPVAGWLTGWGLVSAWDSATYAGTSVQYGITLIVLLAFLIRGALLFFRPSPEKSGPAIEAENLVLLAIRETGGNITPIEAAMQTSLSVDEAEEILSGLTTRGHLRLEIHGGAFYYSVPGKPETPTERSMKTPGTLTE